MIAFILRWQLFMLKREYRYFQNWFPLISSVMAQMLFVLIAFFRANTGFERHLGIAVLYMLVFSIGRAILGYQSLKFATTQGIIGISPLPPSVKSAWVLLMQSINSLITTFIVTLVLGVLMVIRVSAWGGLVLFPISFIFFFGMPFGCSALIEILMKEIRVKQPQKKIASIGGMIIVFGMLILSVINLKRPAWLSLIGQLILNLARLDSRSLPLIGAAALLGLGGYALRVVVTLRTQESVSPVSDKSGSKIYQSKAAPQGLTGLFYWVDAILYRRKSLEYVFLLLMLLFLTYFQRQTWMLGVAMVCGMLGSTQLLSLTGSKGLPLMFIAPVSLRKVWHSRLIAAVPLLLCFWVLSVLVASSAIGKLPTIDVFTSLTVAIASLVCNSLVQLIFRHGYGKALMTEEQKKRRTISSTVIPMCSNLLVPIGLSVLSGRFAVAALLLASVTILISLFTGHHLFQHSRRVRYLWSN